MLVVINYQIGMYAEP